jgi:hypothetical protein
MFKLKLPDFVPCNNNIFISYMQMTGLRFRQDFLKQFIPWLLACDVTADCLDLVDDAAGKKIDCRKGSSPKNYDDLSDAIKISFNCLASIDFNVYYQQFLPWFAEFACITLTQGANCEDSILISFKDVESLRFRHDFLVQFIPWLLSCDITSECLDIVHDAAGNAKRCDKI